MELAGGVSNSRGVCLKGFADGSDWLAYAYRIIPGGEEVVCITGAPDDVMPTFKADKEFDHTESDSESSKDVFIPILIGIALVAFIAFFGGHLSYTIGMLVFVLVAYFPIEAMIVLVRDSQVDTEAFQQYRRNHGAEHTIMGYRRKNKAEDPASLTVEKLSKYSYLDPECGTVWFGSLLILAVVLGVAIAFVPVWGILHALLVVIVALVLLFVNVWLNPANPLKLIQKTEVLKPTEYELETALAAYQALFSLDENVDQH